LTASKAKVAPETISVFEKSLGSLLEKKLVGHWFPENPIRGQAHRSLSLHRHARPDPTLLKAAADANIRNLFDLFSEDVTDVTMFIDPCEVAVQTFYTFCKTSAQETIVYTSPNKLNVRKPTMEPSTTVMSKGKDSVSSSSSLSTSSPVSSATSSPRSSPQRRSSLDEMSGRLSPNSTLKASSQSYSPSPSSSPQRQHSPISYPSFPSGSLPFYVPVPHYYPPYYAHSGFDGKVNEFVRS